MLIVITLRMNRSEQTRIIKEEAAQLGFTACGIAPAKKLEKEANDLKHWLERGWHGGMDYMAAKFDLRTDPLRLMPEAKSVISLLCNYFPGNVSLLTDSFRIARYAYGRDYHAVLREKLTVLTDRINEKIGPVAMRACVDSAPLMEKAWAVRAGLGWIGKNGLLVTPHGGSFMYLGTLLADLELECDHPMTNHCGHCRRCLEACPTKAIVEPGVIDARRCLAYLTIEHKGPLPPSFPYRDDTWIFGCDSCQEVCPFNRFAHPHQEPDFAPSPELLAMTKDDWRNLTEEKYDRLFAASAIRRIGYERLKRNITLADTHGNEIQRKD